MKAKVVSISGLKVFMTQIEWNGNHATVEKAVLSVKLNELILEIKNFGSYQQLFGNKLYS